MPRCPKCGSVLLKGKSGTKWYCQKCDKIYALQKEAKQDYEKRKVAEEEEENELEEEDDLPIIDEEDF